MGYASESGIDPGGLMSSFVGLNSGSGLSKTHVKMVPDTIPADTIPDTIPDADTIPDGSGWHAFGGTRSRANSCPASFCFLMIDRECGTPYNSAYPGVFAINY